MEVDHIERVRTWVMRAKNKVRQLDGPTAVKMLNETLAELEMVEQAHTECREELADLRSEAATDAMVAADGQEWIRKLTSTRGAVDYAGKLMQAYADDKRRTRWNNLQRDARIWLDESKGDYTDLDAALEQVRAEAFEEAAQIAERETNTDDTLTIRVGEMVAKAIREIEEGKDGT